jgi:hypothetical protein
MGQAFEPALARGKPMMGHFAPGHLPIFASTAIYEKT